MRSQSGLYIFASTLSILVSVTDGAPVPNAAPEPVPASFSFNPITGLAPVVENFLAAQASKLANTKPTKTPSSIPEVMSSVKAIIGPRPTGILTMGPAFLAGGLQAGGTEGVTINSPAPAGNINSFKNNNPPPPTPVFPSADPADAPYSVSEDKLRAAIFIPPNFRGVGMTPNPVILVPGTGAFGGVNYEGNFAKIFAQNSSIAQAVWLNVPGAMYDDVQTNAEYIAYAMNYISKMTGTKVSVIGWSQGNLASQWAMKYWPSTRQSTKQLISISPDFHGTTIAKVADFPLIDSVPLPPSVFQQQFDSTLIKTLRAGGGDSAYVPTTSMYSSSFDEVVQPQSGKTASAFILDARNVGAANYEIQQVCPNTPAGDFGTHESLLFNGLTTALAIDALMNGGPAKLERVDLKTVCQQLAHPALDTKDVMLSEGSIPLAAVNLLEFRPGVMDEPKIRDYAKKR